VSEALLATNGKQNPLTKLIYFQARISGNGPVVPVSFGRLIGFSLA
jgi:hypothetical protein